MTLPVSKEAPQDVAALPQTEAGKALMRFMGWGPAWAKKIRRIELEAAAPQIDVERLVSAMVAVYKLHEALRSTPTAEAQLVAAEYARLTPPPVAAVAEDRPTWAHTAANDPAGLYDDNWEPRTDAGDPDQRAEVDAAWVKRIRAMQQQPGYDIGGELIRGWVEALVTTAANDSAVRAVGDRREAALESLMREAYPYVNASTAPNALLLRIDAALGARAAEPRPPESGDE